MEGREIEIEIPSLPEKTDDGFSEKRAARILEGKRVDNSQVKKQQPPTRLKPLVLPKQKILKRAARVEVSRRERILSAHEKNAHAIIDLIHTLGLVAKGSVRREEQLMEEIKIRQKLQEELLNALVLEQRGDLVEDTLSKELQDLIK
ncbi:MAG TPA: hypothetical protein VEW42_01770 [Candidatus Eisenbacteria bacterium]|nr:hypothetical protein [Candidatus Eisenbacteria bacterium]